jgi:hypothetical protein
LLPDIISGADQPKQQIRNVTVVIRAARWIWASLYTFGGVELLASEEC